MIQFYDDIYKNRGSLRQKRESVTRCLRRASLLKHPFRTLLLNLIQGVIDHENFPLQVLFGTVSRQAAAVVHTFGR